MARPILFVDGIFHTGRTENEVCSSMLVENGKIAALDPTDIGRVRRVPLGGQHVYPCLIDGHVHLLPTVALAAGGFEVCRIENGRVTPDCLAGVKEKLTQFAKHKSQSAILMGNGYIATAIAEHRLPNKMELDAWCGNRAVVIYSIDGHSSALSTAMLQKLGIDPAGHDGLLAGEAHERVQGRLTDLIAAGVTPAVLAKGVANFHNACAEFGISCVGALEGNGDSPTDPTTKLIVRLARHFDVDVRFYFQYLDTERARSLASYQKRPRIGGCGDWEMDGAVGAHTAAFSYPYLDTGDAATPYYDQKFIDEQVKKADAAGFQIACHAIGDTAVRRIVAALEKLPEPSCHRIEHCEFAQDADIDAIARMGCAVMMQPGYAWIDKRFLHTYERYLAPEALALLHLRQFVEKGVCVCGSSDSPVQELDPWLQMLGMTQFYRPEESLTAYEAFRCYTANPAQALLEENERGTLAPGCKADFFTADRDLFTLSPEQLGSFRPSATYYGGHPARHWRGTLPELLWMLLKKPKQV